MRTELEIWLPAYEAFIHENALIQNDLENYRRAKAFWRPGFKGEFRATTDGAIHPVIVHNEIVDAFYAVSTRLSEKQIQVGHANIAMFQEREARNQPNGSSKRTE